jgi:cytochrome c peroxidase
VRYLIHLGVAAIVFAGGWHPPRGLDLYRPSPADNPLTSAKIDLGRRLFNDPLLSRDRSISCASCHDPQRAFTDGHTVAQGVGGARGRRNTPTIINRAWGATFFFDGRAATLEQQVLQPILSANELGSTTEGILNVVRTHYQRRFRKAFGSDPTMDLVANALASYVRSIVSGDSDFDRGKLTASARRGLALFRGKADCIDRGQIHSAHPVQRFSHGLLSPLANRRVV